MASVTRRIVLNTSRHPPRIRAQYVSPKCTAQWQRPLSTTHRRHDEESQDSKRISPQSPATDASAVKIEANAIPSTTPAESKPPTKTRPPPPPKPTAEQRLASETAAKLAKLSSDLKALHPDNEKEAIRLGKQGIPWATDYELTRDEDFEPADDKFQKLGFWAEGEESMGPDEDYYGDDLTSLGHGELEKHRELREYARLIAWELPLLNRTYIPAPPSTSIACMDYVG